MTFSHQISKHKTCLWHFCDVEDGVMHKVYNLWLKRMRGIRKLYNHTWYVGSIFFKFKIKKIILTSKDAAISFNTFFSQQHVARKFKFALWVFNSSLIMTKKIMQINIWVQNRRTKISHEKQLVILSLQE